MPDGTNSVVSAESPEIGGAGDGATPQVAPAGPEKAVATPLETALLAVWKSVLEIDEIAVDDDFFLLGGDSLMAATLFAEVSAVFGVELPLRAIFDDGATIEGMAALIETARRGDGARPAYTPKSTEVVVMRGEGALPPLFAVGGSGGHSIGFAHVARLLGPDQPFYGLDSVGLDGAEQPLTCMADIAAEHIRRMRTVQPEGPYYLIGACFGGRVVYEMSQQLRRDGHAVGLTLLLDPSPPFKGRETGPSRSDNDAPRLTRSKATRLFVFKRLMLYWSELRALPWNERGRYVRDKLRVAREVGVTGNLHGDNATQLYIDAVYSANRIAGGSYVAAAYSGPVAVFWSQDRDVGSRTHRAEWLSLLDNRLTVAEVPGKDSGDMLLPPNVEPLTEKIAASLRCARMSETAPAV